MQRANIRYHDAKLRTRPYINQTREKVQTKVHEFKDYSKQVYENQKDYIKSGEYKHTASLFKSYLLSIWTRTQNSFLRLTSNETIKETMHKTSESLVKVNEKMKVATGGRFDVQSIVRSVKNTLKRLYHAFDYYVLTNVKSKENFVMFINRQKNTVKRFFDQYRDMSYKKKRSQPFDKWYMNNRDKFAGMVVYNAVTFFNKFRSLTAVSQFQNTFNTSIRPIMRSDKLRNAFINARTNAKIRLYMLAKSPMWRNAYNKSRAAVMRMFGVSDETAMQKYEGMQNFFRRSKWGFFGKMFGWNGFFKKTKQRIAYRMGMLFASFILIFYIGKGIPRTVKSIKLRKKERELRKQQMEVDKIRLEVEKLQALPRN